MCSGGSSEQNENTQATATPMLSATQVAEPTPTIAIATPSSVTKTPANTYSSETESSKSVSSETNTAEMVWVGNTGTKYHYESCPTLKGNGHQITLQQAINEGRAPCQRCH